MPVEKILVGTTTAAYRMFKDDYWKSWMQNAEAIKNSHPNVAYYAALETDKRGLEPFRPFIEFLKSIGGTYDTFSFDDGSTQIGTNNRVSRICMGQNICSLKAMNEGCSHLMFLAADQSIPDDTIPDMLAIDRPVCGYHVPTYGLGVKEPRCGLLEYKGCYKGFQVNRKPWKPEWDIRVHMQTAAMLFIERSVFVRIKFRCDLDRGLTDDPAFYSDCKDFGIEHYVRHDKVALHLPDCIGSIESRSESRDLVNEERI